MSQAKSLDGLHAIVTGGSRGIGLAIAESLVRAGASVTIMGRDTTRLSAARDELAALGGQVAAVAIDVADPASVATAFAQARTAYGAVDILVNNAGIAESAPFTRTIAAQFGHVLDVNLGGVWHCTQEFAKDLVPRDDGRFRRVVNVASTAGLKGYAYVTAYCAAKHAVVGLTRALALEWAKKPVTVNAVCPGYTDTDIVAGAVANIVAKTGRDEAAAREELARGNPQLQLVTTAQVANSVLWLVSPGSESVTGQAISVSGGEVMQ